MPSQPAVDSYWFRIAVCIAAFSTSLIAFPLLALAIRLPGKLGDALFFWPQYLLLPSGLRSTAGEIYGAGTAMVLAIVAWLVLLALFAKLTQRQRRLWVVPLLFVGVAVVAELAMLALGVAGLAPVLDGL